MKTKIRKEQLEELSKMYGKDSLVMKMYNDLLKEIETLKAQNLKQPDVSPNEGQQLSENKNLPEVALPKPTRADYLQLANDILEEDITPRRINKLIDEFKEKFDWRGNGG